MNIDVKKIKEAFVWLQHNGYEKETENLLHNIKVLYQLAMDENYVPEGDEWRRRLRYAIGQINKLDKAYYEAHGEHFTRKYNRDSKKDMSRYISEIAVAIAW